MTRSEFIAQHKHWQRHDLYGGMPLMFLMAGNGLLALWMLWYYNCVPNPNLLIAKISVGYLLCSMGGFLLLSPFLVNRQIGKQNLLCPGCGKSLTGLNARYIIASGRCRGCKTMILTEESRPTPSEKASTNPPRTEIMTKAEFKERQKRFLHSSRKPAIVLLAIIFGLLAMMLGMAEVLDYFRLPHWVTLPVLIVYLAIFLALIAHFDTQQRKTQKQLGLCCSQCDQSLLALKAVVVLDTGHCGHCGAQILSDPEST